MEANEWTRFSFPVSAEPVELGFFDDIFSEVFLRPTVPFFRIFELADGVDGD